MTPPSPVTSSCLGASSPLLGLGGGTLRTTGAVTEAALPLGCPDSSDCSLCARWARAKAKRFSSGFLAAREGNPNRERKRAAAGPDRRGDTAPGRRGSLENRKKTCVILYVLLIKKVNLVFFVIFSDFSETHSLSPSKQMKE